MIALLHSVVSLNQWFHAESKFKVPMSLFWDLNACNDPGANQSGLYATLRKIL